MFVDARCWNTNPRRDRRVLPFGRVTAVTQPTRAHRQNRGLQCCGRSNPSSQVTGSIGHWRGLHAGEPVAVVVPERRGVPEHADDGGERAPTTGSAHPGSRRLCTSRTIPLLRSAIGAIGPRCHSPGTARSPGPPCSWPCHIVPSAWPGELAPAAGGSRFLRTPAAGWARGRGMTERDGAGTDGQPMAVGIVAIPFAGLP